MPHRIHRLSPLVALTALTALTACSEPEPAALPPTEPVAAEPPVEPPVEPPPAEPTPAPPKAEPAPMTEQIVVKAGAEDFKPCAPGLPPGCEMAIMEGDPAGDGVFSVRFRLADTFVMPPHHHPRSERVTIVSGKVGVGFGDTLDKAKGQVFSAGDFYVNAREAHHYVWVVEPAVLQINGVGPWQAIQLTTIAPPRPPDSAIREAAMPEGTTQLVVKADATQFGPCPPGLPPGCEMAAMEGDAREPMFFSTRFRAKAGFTMPPHHHPMPERVTIVSGKVGVGFGDTLDKAKGQVFSAGDFYVNPPGKHHFVWVEQEAVLQINGVGPWKAIPVKPVAAP